MAKCYIINLGKLIDATQRPGEILLFSTQGMVWNGSHGISWESIRNADL